jgi:hypothetical protein
VLNSSFPFRLTWDESNKVYIQEYIIVIKKNQGEELMSKKWKTRDNLFMKINLVTCMQLLVLEFPKAAPRIHYKILAAVTF